MGFRYPKDVFKTWDLPDDRIVRRMVSPAAEEFNGRLNEHNFVDDAFPDSRQAPAFQYEFHTAAVSVDPAITAPNGYLPQANGWVVPDSGEWAVVGSMSTTWAGAEDRLWVIGWVQYSIVPSGAVLAFSVSETSYTKPRVEFAIRVNGVVMADTITGCADDQELTYQEYYPTVPITPAAANYVSIDPWTNPGCSSLCWHCRAVRFQHGMVVPAGPVTVEIVARRVGPNDTLDITGAMEAVHVFSRKLCAVQMKMGGTGSLASQAAVSVDYPTPYDTFWGSASLEGNILTPLKNAANDLLQGNIIRWGLRREQMPAALLGATQTALTAGTNTVRLYPGYGSTGIVNAGNWAEVNDGAGTNLRATVNWNYTTSPAFVLILANIAFKKSYDGVITANNYGVFALAGQYASGTDFHDAGAEAVVNNPNLLPALADAFDCDTDVPLLLWYDYRSAPPAGGVVSFYRVLAAFLGGAAGQCDWERSSLQVLHFHA